MNSIQKYTQPKAHTEKKKITLNYKIQERNYKYTFSICSVFCCRCWSGVVVVVVLVVGVVVAENCPYIPFCVIYFPNMPSQTHCGISRCMDNLIVHCLFCNPNLYCLNLGLCWFVMVFHNVSLSDTIFLLFSHFTLFSHLAYYKI